MLQSDCARIQQFIYQNQNTEITQQNVRELTEPKDEISAHLLVLESKEKAYEDTLQVLKKGFENE
jgi:hypothetical protein